MSGRAFLPREGRRADSIAIAAFSARALTRADITRTAAFGARVALARLVCTPSRNENHMEAYFTTEALTALFQVIMIDLVLAGDNAIVIGLAAAGLPQAQRAKVIFWGHRRRDRPCASVSPASPIQLLQIIGLLARRRHPAPVGLLEDVARAAPRPSPRPARSRPVPDIRCRSILDGVAAERAAQDLRARRSGRSSLPTSRCRSTTCSPSRAPRATTPTS